MPQTWLITGCSSGLGLHLARVALSNGHNVIATSRNPSKSPDLVNEFTSSSKGKWLTLDVTSPFSSLQSTISQAESLFGGIDVLVNNAGYGLVGAFEDISESKFRHNFETNVFGPMKLIKAVLPGMRARKSGVIVNISSIAGLMANPTFTSYSGSKYAIEALSEALAAEVASFGIRILIVEPGAFRTNFLSAGGLDVVPVSEAYEGTAADKVLGFLNKSDGVQTGDPEKAAQRIFEVVTGTGMGEGKEKYLRLPLGLDCVNRVRAQMECFRENVDAMAEIAATTAFQA